MCQNVKSYACIMLVVQLYIYVCVKFILLKNLSGYYFLVNLLFLNSKLPSSMQRFVCVLILDVFWGNWSFRPMPTYLSVSRITNFSLFSNNEQFKFHAQLR